MTWSAEEPWPFPKAGPIEIKDIPLGPAAPAIAWLDGPLRDDGVATFLNSGMAITVREIVHDPAAWKGIDTVWLQHDGTITRGNVNPIEYSTPDEVDRRIEVGQDPKDHPASTHAGAAKIRCKANAQFDVQYTDSMTEAQKVTLEHVDRVARDAGGTVQVNHIESFGARRQRKEYELLQTEERATRQEEDERSRGGASRREVNSEGVFANVIRNAAETDRGWLRRQVDCVSRFFRLTGRDKSENDLEASMPVSAVAERHGARAGQSDKSRAPSETTITETVFRVAGDRYQTAKSKECDAGLEM